MIREETRKIREKQHLIVELNFLKIVTNFKFPPRAKLKSRQVIGQIKWCGKKKEPILFLLVTSFN